MKAIDPRLINESQSPGYLMRASVPNYLMRARVPRLLNESRSPGYLMRARVPRFVLSCSSGSVPMLLESQSAQTTYYQTLGCLMYQISKLVTS